MGWGDLFTSAWNAATETAKSAGHAVAETAQGAYNYSKEKVTQTADYVEGKAIQAYDYTKEKAVQGYNYTKALAKTGARDTERAVADSVLDGGAGEIEAYRERSDLARRAYDKARSVLGLAPAGKPIQPCLQAKVADETVSNKSIDGWLMVPQGLDKDGKVKNCIAVPPGSNALADARNRAVMSESPCCKARGAGAPPRDIIYVNGVMTDHETHCDTLNAIAALTCGRVVGVYNATESRPADYAQTGQDRLLVKAAAAGKALPGRDGRNPAVDTLSRTIVEEVEAGHPPEIWAHSQGGAITSLALYEANNDLGVLTGSRNALSCVNALSGVKVTSFGSAAPNWVDGPSYEHYIHVNDPVPTFWGLGDDAANDAAFAGMGANVIRFSGDVKSSALFKTVNPDKEWLPRNTDDNHSVDRSYLRMEKQQNGGCPYQEAPP